MNAFELTSAVTALANAFACSLSLNEITMLASVFVQLGDTLATIVTKKSIEESLSSLDKTQTV